MADRCLHVETIMRSTSGGASCAPPWQAVLFPAFRKLSGRAHYRELGENLDDRERVLRGSQGFDQTLAEVAKLETALGIGGLAKQPPGS